MTIASEISRLQWAKADIKTAIENKWVTVGNITLDNYAACIDAIPTWSNIAVVDFLLIWWWGGGWRCRCYNWWWGGAWQTVSMNKRALEVWTYPITIWAWWTQNVNWWDSCFDGIVALGGWAWWCTSNGWNGWNGWWAVANRNPWSWLHSWWKGCVVSGNGWRWWWWWGWACWDWGNACCASNYMWWWVWWLWLCTCLTWHYECFAWGWGWKWYCWWQWCYWWGNTTGGWNWWNATTCWSWWWGWPSCSSSSCRAWSWAWWVLIIVYPSDCGYNISWANCSCVCNWVCVHCFTSSWTLTVS